MPINIKSIGSQYLVSYHDKLKELNDFISKQEPPVDEFTLRKPFQTKNKSPKSVCVIPKPETKPYLSRNTSETLEDRPAQYYDFLKKVTGDKKSIVTDTYTSSVIYNTQEDKISGVNSSAVISN